MSGGSNEFDKEFRYSVGYFHADEARGEVLAWHKCSSKPMYMSYSDFVHHRDNRSNCINCGEPISRWEKMHHNENATDKKSIPFSFKTISHVKVTVNDFMINVGIFSSYYNMWKDTSIFIKSACYDRITINVKTGYTYQFRKMTLSEKDNADKRSGVRNISYYGSSLILSADVLDYLYSIIEIKMKQRHGENVPGYKSYNVEVEYSLSVEYEYSLLLYLNMLITYVRNPYICPLLYKEIIVSSRRQILSPPLKELVIKNDCHNPLLQMFLQSKIPDVKSLRNIVFCDARSFPLLASLSHTFQNIDCIRSIYAAFNKHVARSKYYCTCVDFSATVFKQIVKHKGEKIAAQKIISFIKHDKDNNAYSTLNDMVSCYDELKHCDFDFSSKYNINELHLYLANKAARQKPENRKLHYIKRNLSLESSNDTFSLLLPKDTYELIDIGIQMNICVGSYAEKVVNGRCVILILRDIAGNNPIGCVELHANTIHQVKGPNNRLLQNKERDFINDWVISNDLVVCTDDLPHCSNKIAVK